MKTSHLDRLLAAARADDILQSVAMLAYNSANMKQKSQPHLNTIELYRWMPDHKLIFLPKGEDTPYDKTPYYATVDKNAGDSHYCFQTFCLLRDCFDAGGYTVKFLGPQGIAIDEPLEYSKLRRAQSPPSGNETDEHDNPQFPLPPLPGDVLLTLGGLLNPLTPHGYQRDYLVLKELMPTIDRLGLESASADTFVALGWSIMKGQIEATHQLWLSCEKLKPNLAHPLTPIVYTWLCQQDAKHITPEYDKRRPVAILKKDAMGSIRDVVNTRDEGGSVRSEFIASSAPKEKQLQLQSIRAPDTKLPRILPFELYQHGLATTKSAAVAMPVRLAFEALMQMEPGVHSERLHWQLGDLISCLNPDKKFNWTNQVGYILNGLSALYWLRFPYKPKGEGEVDWIPFLPRAVPNQNSTRDSRIIIEVSLPPDLHSHGMMVEKDVVRLMGKKSSARFNAYLTACWIFDRYGTVNGKIMDPTMPVARRNDLGDLVDKDEIPIFDSHGKPVKNAKSADAARQLDREANPGRDRYPILNNDDLTRSCYPRGVPTEQRREYLKRAKRAWTQIEADRFVRIERFDSGWRIMPSERHITLYRTLKRKT